VLDLLLGLANDTDTDLPGAQAAAHGESNEKDIADMDLDDLVNAAFMNDDE
jgi:polyketide synthase 12